MCYSAWWTNEIAWKWGVKMVSVCQLKLYVFSPFLSLQPITKIWGATDLDERISIYLFLEDKS